MEEIRVLHLISTLVSGGVQNVVMGYGKNVRPFGIIFDYIVQGEGNADIEDQLRANGSRIYMFPSLSRRPIAYFAKLFSFLKGHPEYQIVHIHLNYLNGLPMLAAKLAGVKVRISHSHSNRKAKSMAVKIYRAIGKLIITSNATDLWACSEPAYRWLYGRKDKGRFILNNAIDDRIFTYDSERREKMRISLDLIDKYVCVCVGTLSEIKNQIFLLKVFRSLRSYTDIRLLIVGDGNKRKELLTAVKELDLSETVILLGDRDDVPSILHASDCFLLPSRNEGISVSTIEAQISGLPCIVSSGVTPDVKISERIDFLDIQDNNITEWSHKILSFYKSHLPRSGMSMENIRESGYALSFEAKKLANKYKELIAR